jgi:hypothetical protein
MEFTSVDLGGGVELIAPWEWVAAGGDAGRQSGDDGEGGAVESAVERCCGAVDMW